MPNIKITVTNKRAAVVGSPVIVCGNSDYTMTFAFDEEWSGVEAKTARFVYVKAGEVQHEDKLFIGDTVDVPVLSDIAFVKVGVFAGNISTTTPARILCDTSILCGSGAPHEPTPDVYNQIIALLEELERLGQVLQIEQNRLDIAALVDGTQTVGKAAEAANAEKLGGKPVDDFTTTEQLQEQLTEKLGSDDVVDNLLSTNTTVPLSANQGRVLSEMLGGHSLVALSETEHNSLTQKDENTFYFTYK